MACSRDESGIKEGERRVSGMEGSGVVFIYRNAC